MPLYVVKQKGADKLRLIEAKTEAQAIAFAVGDAFTAKLSRNASEIATILSGGVKMEKAPDPAPRVEAAKKAAAATGDSKSRIGEEFVNVETGMVERYTDEGVTSEDVRKATAEEIAAAKAEAPADDKPKK